MCGLVLVIVRSLRRTFVENSCLRVGEEGVELQQGHIAQMLEEQPGGNDLDLAEAHEAQLL